ncbi:alpha/beta-type small acid-soluble spore protein [Paenibacillus methanolicus]|uniref:Small acid-soluble spore protein alpha/beta type n=1 Tax=Paenibacillus methanolicus TaxID=582686 RepID=A0A5S5CBI3_9BACL|nr:alpha/beta-type small acid-soluble spore protein [Paenibacillus methanolicus]TYP75706.1 small acid-soluble spore protein alpha/beta type [Paenibacillus methanolicus]
MAKRRSNIVVVPEARAAIDQMKYEIAAELGLTAGAVTPDRLGMTEFAADDFGAVGESSDPASVPWSRLATRDVGYIGGSITRRLVEQAERVLNGL